MTNFLIHSIEIQLSEMITMIAYVTLGSNNIESAELFYSAFLLPLGYQLFKEGNGDLSYCLPKPSEMAPQLPDVYIKAPFNGKPASAGNGQMIAFEVPSQKKCAKLSFFSAEKWWDVRGGTGLSALLWCAFLCRISARS
jgi:hypothetical protein